MVKYILVQNFFYPYFDFESSHELNAQGRGSA